MNTPEIENTSTKGSFVDRIHSLFWNSAPDTPPVVVSENDLIKAAFDSVRNLAITLGVGILTTMFTAFTMTRFFVAMWVKRNRPKEINL